MISSEAQGGRWPRLIQAAFDAFSLPDLRAKILFTLAILALYRFVADAPFGNQLAQPHQEHGSGGQGQDGGQGRYQRRAGETDAFEHVALLQQNQLAKPLGNGDGNG